jgi:DNA-binding response OmpR family regulator
MEQNLIKMGCKKILVVDDEADICYLISSVLKKAGQLNIETASSIQSASAKVVKFRPSLVFLDNHLGDGMGVDYIPVLKQTCEDCKVVMVSAYDTSIDRMKATKNGADAFISKPFTKEAIINVLSNL